MKSRKRIALIMVIIMLFNMFSPYTLLFNTVEAATGVIEERPLIFNNLGVTTKGANKMLTLEIGMVSEEIINGFDLQFKLKDTSKIIPCNRNTGAPSNVITLCYAQNAYSLSTVAKKTYTASTKTFRFTASEPQGGTDIVNGLGYVPGAVGDPAIDDNGSGFPAYYPIINLYFKIVDDSLDLNNLQWGDLFELVPVTGSLPTGLKISYKNQNSLNVSKDFTEVALKGFAVAAKKVDSISVKTNPNNTTYDHGDTVDLTGGVITVTYDDGTTEDVDMTDPNVKISSGSPADVDDTNVELTYEGKTASFPITVNDPVMKLEVVTPMSDLEYDHGENFDFTGLTLKATKKSGKFDSLTATSPGVTVSETVADVNSSNFTQSTSSTPTDVKGTQKITFTYKGKDATQTAVVNDTITGIQVISQPNKKVYKYDESLDLSGAVVEVSLGSGGTVNVNLPDGNMKVSTYNPKTTGKKQNLTVSFGTFTASQTIDVEVYDYITGKTLTAPTKDVYNYNDELSLTGGRFRFNWKSGTTTQVNLTDSSVSVTGYDKTKIGSQELTATYTAKYTLSDGTIITDTFSDKFYIELEDLANTIVIKAPTKDTYNHGENFDFTGGSITVTTKSGKTINVPMTKNMIFENDGTTAASLSPASYDSTQKTIKTLKIKYSQDAKSETVDYPVTIINDVKSIAMHKDPKKVYNVNDTLDVTNGEILVTRASGTPEVIKMTDSRVKVEGFSSAAENNNLQLTVKFTENGVTKQTNYNVSVKDTVKTVILKTEPKKDYKYNEELDVTGGVLTVTKGSGTTDVPMTKDMVTGYDKTKLGEQTLTVTYGGQTVTYKVNVKDYITKIEVAPDTITGKYDDELSKLITDNNIKYTVTYAKAGAQTPVTLTTGMVAGYNKQSVQTQNLTVTYTDSNTLSATNGQNFTDTLNITLTNEAKVIDITPPTKVVYNHGDSLDLTGGKIELTYADETKSTVPMTVAMITENGSSVNMSPTNYDSTNKVAKTLKITYSQDGITKTVNYPITIINDVKSIAMHKDPKKVYNVNDSLDVTNGEIAVTRAVGTPEVIKMTDSRVNVDGFSSAAENNNLQLTVKFTENGVTKQTNYNVSVKDTVKSISIKTEPKKDYKYNEELDVTGGVLTVTKGSGTTDVPMTKDMVTGYDKTKLGEQTLTVTYGGQTTTYKVNVKDYVTGITVVPNTVSGKYDDELSKLITDNNIKYTVTYAKAGAQTSVALTDSMVAGYNKQSVQLQNLTVTYTDSNTLSATNGQNFTTNLKITLANVAKTITITPPTKVTYNHGESLDVTGGKIEVVLANGTKTNVIMTANMIFESDGTTAANMSPASYDSTQKTTKTLKITYSQDGVTKTVNYPVTIINDVKSIAMHKEPKKVYNVNDTLDVTDGEILVTRAFGTPETVKMTDSRVKVDGFSSATENTNLPLTVKFTENDVTKQTNYNVSVKDTVKSISIKTEPKKDYKYNEELDVTGGVLTVVKGSETTDVPMQNSMVTGYDKTKLGEQTLTVTYGGQTTTYKVNVKDYVIGIAITPSTVTGKYNDALSKIITDNSIKYTVTYAKAGAQTPVVLVDSAVTGYNSTSIQEQNLTVTYIDNDVDSSTNGQTFTGNFKVTLEDTVSEIIVTPPTKVTYNHGESLDVTGGTITVTTQSGQSKTVPMSANMIFESNGTTVANMSPTSYDNTQKIEKTLKIKYTEGGKTGSIDYPITIVNDVKSIKITKDPKKSYNVNDTLDVSTGEIEVTRASGTPETVKMTDSRVNVDGFSSAVENTNLPLTVKFTENGITKQTNYNVSVKDTVKSITIKTEPKKDYKYNEELDVTGGVLTVVKGSETQDIPMTKDMVTGYDKTKLGEQTLTVTYGGQTTTYKVNVKDYVTGITITPSTVTGKYNDALSKIITDNNIKYTVTYAKAGAQTPVALTDSAVTGYNPTSIQEQNLTVTYTDNDATSATNGQQFTSTLTINLSDTVAGITIVPPTKVTYNHGESLDVTGGTITVTTQSGQSKTVPMTANMIFEDDGTTTANMSPASYDNTQKIEKTLKIKYSENGQSKTVDYPITIINDVKSIEMHKEPKKSYNVNDTLDVTNGEILVTRASGTPQVVKMTDSRVKVEGFSSATENTNLPLTVKFTENGITKQTNYNVSVKDTVKSITIKKEPKKDYKYNEELDVTGGVLTVVKGSETTDVPMQNSMVTGYDKTKLGEQTLTVTYGGQTTTYKVNVKDYVTGITVVPNAVNGKYNEELSKVITDNNIKYTVTYAKGGAQTPVALTDSMVAGYNKQTIQVQNLTVTYTDKDATSATNGQSFTANLKITLSDAVSSIVVTPPTKVTYNHGESLDVTGGTITVTTQSGQSKTVPMTANMIFEDDGTTAANMSPTSYDNTNKVQKTLKIKYTEGEKTGSVDYPITIINDIKSIEMHKDPKKAYNVNDKLDITNGEILVTRASGTPQVVKMTDSRVSVEGFASNVENKKLPLTVKFTENGVTKQTSYDVSIQDTVKSITIKTEPKKDYKYNEELDVTGGVLTVVKGSETKDISMTKDMVTGYDKTKLGTQTLTVTYGGQTTTYKVNVKDYVTGITVVPNAVNGKYNEELSKVITDNNIKYTVTYAKGGAQTPVALTDSAVTGYNPTSIQEQNLTVTYKDNDKASATNGQSFTANLKVTLSDAVSNIVVTPPTKVTYNHGESLDVTGGTITVVTQGGQSKTVPMAANMIFENDGTTTANMSPTSYDNTNKVQKTLKIKYTEGGKTGSVDYQVTIINDVKSIEMHKDPKKAYNVNDKLDITNGEILVTRASGTPQVVKMTDSRVKVEGFESNVENKKLPLTVKFTENGVTKQTSYDVSIKDTVKSITIKADAKKDYRYNEELDVQKGIITVVKGSKTQDIPMTKDMVTGYDKTKLGEQTLTVTYGGQTATYKVFVKDYVTGIEVIPNTIKGEYNDTLEKLIKDKNIKYAVTYAKGGAQTPVALTDSMVTGYNKETTDKQDLTVTYIDNDILSATNGDTFTGKLEITLVDPVMSIKVTQMPDKVDYGYGEELDPTGGKITVTRKSGKTEEKPLTDKGILLTEDDGTPLNMENVQLDNNHKGTKEIQVNYEGFKEKFDVNITNKLTEIKVNKLPKTDYKVGQSEDLTAGEVTIIRQNGEKEIIKLNDQRLKVEGFDSSEENTSLPITVKYTENGVSKEDSYQVSIIDTVIDVQIDKTPKTAYKYGEKLDVSTGTLKVIKDSGEKIIPIKDNMVTELDGSKFNPNKLGTRKLNVTYGGKVMEYEVTVSDFIKEIVLTPPSKIVYEYGESLDTTTGEIEVIMASGNEAPKVPLSSKEVTLNGYNPNEAKAQTVQVVYKGFKESFGVIVEDNIQTIAMNKTPKTQYKYGENLDIKGGSIVATRSSGKTEVIEITNSMVTGFKPDKLGNQSLNVEYKGKQTSYIVNVKDYMVGIELDKPKKLVYKLNEKFDPAGGKINLVMASGNTTTPVDLSKAKITGFDTSKEGAVVITVNYEGFKATFGITVVDELSAVTIKTLPDKLDYKYGENLDIKGGTLEVEKESGAKTVIPMTNDMVSGYNPKKLGDQKIIVTYEGFKLEFIVNVKDYVVGLNVKAPDKKEYEYSEYLDLDGGEVSLKMASGAVQDKAEITASMVSGFNRKQEGTQTIKVNYKGLEGRFQVVVVDKIKGISMNTEPNKIIYNYGEDIDTTGGSITVVKSSGVQIVPITKDMITGYDAQTPGTQIITVSYGGFTTKFIVMVNEKPENPDKPVTPDKPVNPDTPVTPDKPVTPNKPERPTRPNRPVRPTTPVIDNTISDEPVVEEPIAEQPVVEEPIEVVPPVVTEEPTEEPEEKPVEVLGVKDEKQEKKQPVDNTIIARGIAGLALLLLLILLLFRRNVKIFVEEDGKFELAGLEKISKRKLELDIDKYLDDENYNNRVKIRLSDAISEKLDGKEIEIRHRGQLVDYTIEYNDEPFVIILDELVEEEHV